MKNRKKIFIEALAELKYFLFGAAVIAAFLLVLPPLANNGSADVTQTSQSENARLLNLYDSGLDNLQNRLTALENIGPGTVGARDSRALNAIKRIDKKLFTACIYFQVPASLNMPQFNCRQFVRQARTSISQSLRGSNRAEAHRKIKELLENLIDRIEATKSGLEDRLESAETEDSTADVESAEESAE